jgi:hypothetical protein
MLRDPEQKVLGWENPPYTSFTSGYRTTTYAATEKDDRYFIYALKAFPMSPNSNEISMQIVRNYVLKARDLVIEEILEKGQQVTDRQDKKISNSDIRTTENWWGNNEYIPLKYLIPSNTVSIEETLKNNPFCAHLNDDQVKKLLTECKKESIPAGKVICNEGDKADKVYLILDGKVKVYKNDKQGHETEITILEKGNMFGEMALFDKGFRSASVRSIDVCQFLIFEGDKFLELILG